VATPGTILKEIEQHMPSLYQGLMQLENIFDEASFEKNLAQVYDKLDSVSFDYGIMEKTTAPVYAVPCECGWSDVGSWASLHELKEGNHDASGNVTEGETALLDCKNSYVSAMSGRMVACLGIKGLVVVDTEDAVLVADINRAQDIKAIVDQLKNMKKEELL
jgi:mannose-1-phosphate guanylyltransferase